MSNVSFLGLGVMGYPIAGHLARAGLKVTVFNRTIKKAKKWKEEYGCSFEQNVSEAVKDSDFVSVVILDHFILKNDLDEEFKDFPLDFFFS